MGWRWTLASDMQINSSWLETKVRHENTARSQVWVVFNKLLVLVV